MTKSPSRKNQNEISHNYLKGSNLAQRELEVLEDACKKSGFIVNKLVGRSSWWGSSEIGAFHYDGNFQGKRAVIKIQGVKPLVSEAYMINSFKKANQSKTIRPPYLYANLPWDESKRYEALILEFIEGDLVIHLPTNKTEVKRFFELYQEYQENCLNSPWLDQPEGTISEKIIDNFAKWRETSTRIYPEHSLRKNEDKDLIDSAVTALVHGYQNIEPQFMHGHLSDGDLYQVDNQVVLLSNLYWSWRPPFYDAIFGYHWFMYHLNDVENITTENIEKQRDLWLEQIYSLPQTQGQNRKLLNLALLERATAGLNLDALSTNPDKPISKYLIEETRKQIKKLLKELS